MPSARALRPTAAWSTSTPSSAIRWAAGGPTSISGPASPTAHQQAYIDWIYRAYQGGLRLIICSIVHNEALASASGGSGPRDDRGAIVAQAEAAKEMITVQERRAGGPGLAPDRLLARRSALDHRRGPTGRGLGSGGGLAGQLAPLRGPSREVRP